jgi:hypothetical protein
MLKMQEIFPILVLKINDRFTDAENDERSENIYGWRLQGKSRTWWLGSNIVLW